MTIAGDSPPAARKLVVIGHSHTETVTAAASAQGVALDMLNFWHLPDPFVTENGRLALKPALRARLVAPVFSMVGGAVHQDIGLVLHPRPFDFVWPDRPDLPVMQGADIIPYDALHAVMLEQTGQYRDIMSAVRHATAGPVFHMESPPVFAAEELPQDDPGFYHLFGADAAFSPAWLRYKLWRVHSGIIAAHCRLTGIIFIPHPPESVDDRGFMLPAYRGTPAHANAAYGALVLAQMRHAAAACQDVPPPRQDIAIVAYATSQDAADSTETVEGWVDGCQGGMVSGWAWRVGAPAEKLILDIFADGNPAGDGAAIIRRADLAESGKGDGVCGFAIPVTAPPGARLVVRVRNGAALPGDPAIFAPPGDARAAPDTASTLWPPLPWALHHGMLGNIDGFGPDGINGWAQNKAAPSTPVVLDLFEGDMKIASLTAFAWRKDLEETRQGDGRWGLADAMPARLRDGRTHRLHLRHADGSPALDHAIILRMPPAPDLPALPAQADPPVEEDKRPSMVRPPRAAAQDGIVFSIVVNFYNMAREAARTLTSLSRAYQRDIGALRYEVLCVDNYSDPPLAPDWIESFGAEFRLIRPSRKLPSPVAAINEAAAQARGKYIAVMIDGAHLLTPGVLREVWDAVTEAHTRRGRRPAPLVRRRRPALAGRGGLYPRARGHPVRQDRLAE